MSRKLRAAILGFGGMGHYHATQYAIQKDVELVAVCDINPKQLETDNASINLGNSGKAKIQDLHKYLCYEDLIAGEKLDYIDICLPTYLHAEYTIRAMKDGFNVLCEKPMALTVKDCDAMIQAGKETGKLFMIAQCLRFDAGYEYIRSAIKSRKYGKLVRLSLHRVSGLPGGWFRDVKLSGGALMDLHIHDLDWLLSVFGKPVAMTCFGGVISSGGIDDMNANYIYPDGLTAVAESSWARCVFSTDVVAMFDKGTLEYSGGKLKFMKPDTENKEIALPADNNMYAQEIAYFASCVKKNVQPERCLPESTRETIRVIYDEIRSAKATGKKVRYSSATK